MELELNVYLGTDLSTIEFWLTEVGKMNPCFISYSREKAFKWAEQNKHEIVLIEGLRNK